MCLLSAVLLFCCTVLSLGNHCCASGLKRPLCIEKTCTYNDQTYKVGDTWTDAAHPCMSFSCSKEGVLTETKVCLDGSCPEEDRIWDDKHCCFTCNQTCIPRVSSVNITIDNCTTVIQIPVCQGQCTSQPRVVLQGDLLVQEESRCCQEDLSEWRSLTLRCFDLTARNYTYNHVTSCVCRICSK